MQIKKFHGFVYTRATAAANFIYISTGIPSDVHEDKKIAGRALCVRAVRRGSSILVWKYVVLKRRCFKKRRRRFKKRRRRIKKDGVAFKNDGVALKNDGDDDDDDGDDDGDDVDVATTQLLRRRGAKTSWQWNWGEFRSKWACITLGGS